MSACAWTLKSSDIVFMSHTCNVLSARPTAISLMLEISMDVTRRVCPINICISRPEFASQILSVSSWLPVMMRSRLSVNTAPVTHPACPANSREHVPVWTSNMAAQLSVPPTTICSPVESKRTDRRYPAQPVSVCSTAPEAASQMRHVESCETDATRPPCLAHDTPQTVPLCPWSVRRGVAVSRGTSSTAPDPVPAAISVPSGAKSTDTAKPSTGIDARSSWECAL
mmetsp:Transcript_52126/g.124172  ORF Transcript_52126/g.124172 Transcript_52126/m.124172 type:complete len:226 (-) Transcript_52126:1535-2212(-)